MTAAGLDGVILESEGCRLLGGLYRAAGEGPRPAVVLLHGIPGHEKNLDLAIALRQVGFHVLYFHYRGCWGSEGDYHLGNLVPDALAALSWLAAQPLVDAARLALVGMSLGGWAALAAAAEAPQVAAVVALSPLVDPRRAPLSAEAAQDFARSLHGTSGEALLADWAALPAISDLASRLRDRPILLATADRDEYFPPEHYFPLQERLPQMEWVRFPQADHLFSAVRPGLRHLVRRWLLDRFVDP